MPLSSASNHDASQRNWTMDRPPDAETVLCGEPYLYFAGTGYLGLQGHPLLLAAAQAAIAQYGIHTATSRSGYGTSPPVHEVETRAADWLGREQSLYLASGYAGNFALAAALKDAVDLAFVDSCAHDCLCESTRWLDHLRLPAIRFRHRDVDHLDAVLRENVRAGERPLVLTDGIFAASGNFAPLGDYYSILSRFDGSMLLVDDAHGLGTVGASGLGCLELAGVDSAQVNRDPEESVSSGPRVFHATTLSKAVGGQGGLVAGSARFVDRVRRSSGWFRGASAPAAAMAAASAKGIQLIRSQPSLRERLAENVTYARSGLQRLGLQVETTPSPVIGISLATAARMAAVYERLLQDHIAIGYTRDYAGVEAGGMLRVAIFATHTREMIDRLLESLGQALAATG